jgi:hypothetical protein
MKNYILTTATLIALCFASSCDYVKREYLTEKKPFRTVSVMRDLTDQCALTDTQVIMNFIKCSDDEMYGGMVYRGSYISSEDRPVDQIVIHSTLWLTAERTARVSAVKQFRTNVLRSINTLKATNEQPKQFSMVAKSISREINALAVLENDRVLICFSDLLESTPAWSFYNTQNFLEAKRNPKAVAEKFQQMVPIPDTKGITAYFLYQPKDYYDQAKYDVALIVVKTWLESRGVKVISSPNLLPNV